MVFEFLRDSSGKPATINDSLQVWKLRTADRTLTDDERNAAKTEFNAGRDLLMETARRTVREHKNDPCWIDGHRVFGPLRGPGIGPASLGQHQNADGA